MNVIFILIALYLISLLLNFHFLSYLFENKNDSEDENTIEPQREAEILILHFCILIPVANLVIMYFLGSLYFKKKKLEKIKQQKKLL